MSEQIRQNWFLLGDIHGSAEPIRYFYYQNREGLSLDDCDNHIILLGDVGCNFALAKDAGAVLRISGMVLVDTELFDKFLDANFREESALL